MDEAQTLNTMGYFRGPSDNIQFSFEVGVPMT